MPRISREAALVKENFVIKMLNENKHLTNKEIQDAIKTEFASAMNSVKVNALRAKTLSLAAPEPEGQTPVAENPSAKTRIEVEIRPGLVEIL